jgi:hypothetical protein
LSAAGAGVTAAAPLSDLESSSTRPGKPCGGCCCCCCCSLCCSRQSRYLRRHPGQRGLASIKERPHEDGRGEEETVIESWQAQQGDATSTSLWLSFQPQSVAGLLSTFACPHSHCCLNTGSRARPLAHLCRNKSASSGTSLSGRSARLGLDQRPCQRRGPSASQTSAASSPNLQYLHTRSVGSRQEVRQCFVRTEAPGAANGAWQAAEQCTSAVGAVSYTGRVPDTRGQ